MFTNGEDQTSEIRGQSTSRFTWVARLFSGMRYGCKKYFVGATDGRGDLFFQTKQMWATLARWAALFLNNVGMPHTTACCTILGTAPYRVHEIIWWCDLLYM